MDPLMVNSIFEGYCFVMERRSAHPNVPWSCAGGVGVLLAADSQSTSKSEYRASLWDP
jgi:hypothetical protein